MREGASRASLAGDVLKRLARELASHSVELPKEVRGTLRKTIQVPGFRDPFRAPQALLEAAILEHLQFSGIPMAAVRWWASRHRDLVDRVKTKSPSGGRLDPWTLPDEFPEENPVDVVLAGLYLVGVDTRDESAAASCPRVEGDAAGPCPEPLAAYLKQIRELPAEHAAWDALETFVSSLRAIAAEKLAERASKSRRRELRECIEELQRHHPDPLWAQWSDTACPEESVGGAVGGVRELIRLNNEYRAVESELRSAPVSRRAELLSRLAELHEQIRAHAGTLVGLLAPTARPPGPGAGVEIAAARTGAAGAAPCGPVATERPSATVLEPPPAEERRGGAPRPSQSPESLHAPPTPAGPTAGATGGSTAAEPTESRAGPEARRVAAERPPLPGAVPEALPRQPEVDPQRIWELLVREGPELAWWYARTCEHFGHSSAVPLPVLRLLSASRNLNAGRLRPEYWATEVGDFYRYWQQSRPWDPATQAFCAAACLLPALTELDKLATHILEPLPDPFTVANPLIECVRSFSRRWSAPLSRRDLQGSPGQDPDAVRRELQARAAEWLSVADRHRIAKNYLPANLVYWHLCREGEHATHVIFHLLAPVAGGREDAVDEVERLARRYGSREEQDRLIQHLQQVVLADGHTVGALQGWARKLLLEKLSEAVELSQRWVRAVRARAAARGPDERHTQLRSFINDAKRLAAEILSALDALEPGGPTRAARRVLRDAVEELSRFLSGNAERPVRAPEGKRPDDLLGDWLLRVPGLALREDPDGHLEPAGQEAWERLAFVADTPLWDWAEAVSARARSGEFDLARRALEYVSDPEKRRELEKQLGDLQPDARREVERMARELEDEVEEATLHGVMEPDERSRLQGTIESVRERLRSEAWSRPRVESELEDVKRRLRVHRREAVARVRKRWEALRQQLRKKFGAEASELVGLAEDAIGSGNVALAYECLATAERALQHNLPRLLRPPRTDPARTELGLYLAAREHLEEVLRDGRPDEFLQHGQVTSAVVEIPPGRADEVTKAFEAWRALRRMSREHGEDPWLAVRTVVAYLGFRPDIDQRPHIRKRGLDFLWYDVHVARTTSPLPEFGSELQSTLPVVVVWAQPGAERIEQILRECGWPRPRRGGVLVLCTGILAREQRRELARRLWKSRIVAAVIDEPLLLWLAREPDVRLSWLLRCSYPFAGGSPYRPEATRGSLPEEMFYGRESEISELLQPLGPSYMYGGRQLGKSSLLAMVQRRFHAPDEGRFALYQDIKEVGSPGSLHPEPQDALSLTTRALAQVMGLPSARGKSPLDPLRRHLAQYPEHSVLVLLDEADKLLMADAARGFPVVAELHRLNVETAGRFRVIFAGLRTVRRYRHYPNQPLVTRGVTVGPLEPQHARELIRRPLEFVGLDPDESAVLRILSATNYHPALIQLVCDRVVSRYRDRLPDLLDAGGLVRVGLGDVEDLLRDPAVRKEIGDRFEWTLSLDPYYGVLVRSLVLNEMVQEEPFRRAYSVPELREVVFGWCGPSISGMEADEVAAYAEELTDMGVLVQSQSGFQLRSPNLARLLGSQEDVQAELDRNCAQVREAGSAGEAAEETHPRVGSVHSPLSLRQLRKLGLGTPGVTAIVAVPATGLDGVAGCIEALSQLRGIPVLRLDWDGSGASYEAVVGRGDREVTTVIVRVAGNAAKQFPEVLRAVRGRLRRRLVAVLDAGAVDAWSGLPDSEQARLEADANLIRLQPWTLAAVRRVLEELEIPYPAEKLVELTGGYHMLMLRALEPAGQAESWQAHIRGIEAWLRSKAGRVELLCALQLERDGELWRAARELAELLNANEPAERQILVELLEDQGLEGAAGVIRRLTVRSVLVSDPGGRLYIPVPVHAALSA